MIFNKTKYNTHWPTKELKELGDFSRGKSKHRPRNDVKLFENGKYPLVQTGEIKAANLYLNEHSTLYNDFGLKQSKLWDKGTLCITIAANIAETAILEYPMCFPDSVVGFTANPEQTSELFMHYIFTYIKKSIQNSTLGSIQDNINIGYLTGLKFKIPDQTTQRSMEELLGAIDKKIDLNNKINKELEEMARTIFNYWFVQFDFPDENGKPYKSSGGAMEYSEELKREIPKGWEVFCLNDLGSFKNGINYSSKDFGESTVRIVNVRDISNSTYYILKDDLDEISLPSKEVKKYLIKENDILVARSSSPGATRLIHEDIEGVIFSGFIINFTVKQKENKNYLFHTIKRIEQAITESMTGTILKNVGQDYLKEIKVALPKSTVLDIFNAQIDLISSNMYTNCKQNQELINLRDFLLPLLMNGQAKVK